MEHDDGRVGRLLSRREALGFLGAAGGALFTGSITGQAQEPFAGIVSPSCVVRPEQEEGPYFLDEQLNRSDIRSDPTNDKAKAGAPLALAIIVSKMGGGGCLPIPGAVVDLWQCDAFGAYSDVKDPLFSTIGQKFLRGFQLTDAAGTARFTTIYPGWYPTRTVHIHFKIRTAPGSGRSHEFTSQLYFDDRLTDRVHASPPYLERGTRRVRNSRDGIFRDGGRQLMLTPTADGDGYSASFAVGLALD
jgi:protocatechuate 3,4-dioxygenase beta subunit